MVSLMASFVLSFFPLDVLDEIWDLIESVSEGLLTYSYSFKQTQKIRELSYTGNINTYNYTSKFSYLPYICHITYCD